MTAFIPEKAAEDILKNNDWAFLQKLILPIKKEGLNLRASSALINLNAVYLGDLASKTEHVLSSVPNFSAATKGYLKAKALAPHRLDYSMEIYGWPNASCKFGTEDPLYRNPRFVQAMVENIAAALGNPSAFFVAAQISVPNPQIPQEKAAQIITQIDPELLVKLIAHSGDGLSSATKADLADLGMTRIGDMAVATKEDMLDVVGVTSFNLDNIEKNCLKSVGLHYGMDITSWPRRSAFPNNKTLYRLYHDEVMSFIEKHLSDPHDQPVTAAQATLPVVEAATDITERKKIPKDFDLGTARGRLQILRLPRSMRFFIRYIPE